MAGFLVSGCGADGVWGNAYESLKMAVMGAPELEISRQSVDQTPYAMIAVRIGKLPGAILVLSERKGGANYWLSSNNISIVTNSGRLIRTVGLDRDLNLVRIEGNDPLVNAPHRLDKKVQYSGYMEVLRPEPDNFSMQCHLEPGEAEQITIAELQFDTMHMIENCSSAILVLSERKGGANYWLSSNNISIVTNSGRLIRTVGLDRDLNLVRIEGNDPLVNAPHRLDKKVQYSGYMEVLRPEPDNFSMQCHLEPGEAEQITIAELQFDTMHMIENCRTSTGWKFKNHYWVDPYDGFIWQSRQHFLKGIPPMTIRVLKPAA